MDTITFKAAYGDIDKTVVITFVTGGHGVVHLNIDRLYYGQFAFRQGKWVLLLQNPQDPELTLDDRQILCDILTEHSAGA